MRKVIIMVFLVFALISLSACGKEAESKEILPVTITVARTGNMLTGVGKVDVYIDDEKVFDVSNNSTESVKVKLEEGVHTIQTKGQGDKSKKLEFEVSNDGDNELYYATEISNWWGVKLEKRNVTPIE